MDVFFAHFVVPFIAGGMIVALGILAIGGAYYVIGWALWLLLSPINLLMWTIRKLRQRGVQPII